MALPQRIKDVAIANGRLFANSIRWLVTSKEHTNYTYDLTRLNVEHMAWFVANVTGINVTDARAYIREIMEDHELARHVAAATNASARRWLADSAVLLGRRAGWYAMVRALRPRHVVETGTDKGLGSVVLAAAIIRNEVGRLTTIDINPASGYLIRDRYATVTDRLLGDSAELLPRLSSVDLFLHDSDHSASHERRELDAVAPVLSERSLVLSDNSEITDVLPRWAEESGRVFSFFCERPFRHWSSGGGIGAAYQG